MSPTSTSSRIAAGWQHARRFSRRAARRARRAWRDVRARVDRRAEGPTTPTSPPRLAPREALAENGFYVFRGLFTPEECAELAKELKEQLGVVGDQERTSIDATTRFDVARRVLFDERILNAVRAGIGDDARFLQVSDVQYHHDHVGWHRDSPYRGHDCSGTPDWADTSSPYRVTKIIVYLESDDAGMGILAGSHLDPIEMNAGAVRRMEREGQYTVISTSDDPNRRFSDAEKARPVAWAAGIGDALLFDERMYHCGRRVEGDHVIADREGKKLTLSFVFGDDNAHSARMYSYFRYARRDLKYRELPASLASELDARGLAPSAGWGNYFERQPDELRGAYLRDESQMDELIAEFAQRAPAG